MIERVSRTELAEIFSIFFAHISEDDRDEMAILSYLHANPLIRSLMWNRYECIAHLARIRSTDVILEFGCGFGVFLPELCKRARTVLAMDLHPEYAQILVDRRHLDVQFIRTLGEIPDSSLDAIIAADVLEHICDVEPYLRSFTRKLVPGGRLLVSGPTENILYKAGRILAGFAGRGGYHHTNIRALLQRIEAAGFRAVSQRNLPRFMPPYLFTIAAFQVPRTDTAESADRIRR